MNADTLNNHTNTLQLVLFVAADSPRSQRARANLDNYLKRLDTNVSTDEIDVIAEPGKALEYGIFATPALMYWAESGMGDIVYGDLSDTNELQHFLSAASTSLA